MPAKPSWASCANAGSATVSPSSPSPWRRTPEHRRLHRWPLGVLLSLVAIVLLILESLLQQLPSADWSVPRTWQRAG